MTPHRIAVFCVLSFVVCMNASAQTAKPPSGNARDDAKDVACVMEGSFTLLGVPGDVKDCMENKGGLTQNEFKQACEALAQTSAMLGGTAGKVTYSGSCPLGPIAVCDDVPRRGLNSFYYKETVNRMATDLKAGCAALGGRAR
jgi:hypothetical protein